MFLNFFSDLRVEFLISSFLKKYVQFNKVSACASLLAIINNNLQPIMFFFRISSPLKAIGCYVETKRIKKESTETDSGTKSNTITIATLKLPLPINFMESK